MGLQCSGTTWNSFSHRKRKVPGLACQSSFSPQNRGQLYLSTPWESAWSKDANLHLAGRKPGFYFSQLPAGGAHVTASQLCVASPLQQRPVHAVMLQVTSSLKDQGQGRGPLLKKHGGSLKESPPLTEPESLWGGGGEEDKETGSNPGLSLLCAGLQPSNPPRSFIYVM